jgi:hypothetical protein
MTFIENSPHFGTQAERVRQNLKDGSWRSGLPGGVSSGEATVLSYDPQLGLLKDALDEGIAIANSLVDFQPRIQCRVYGSFQARGSRLKSREEVAVGERFTDHQYINITLRSIRSLRNRSED